MGNRLMRIGCAAVVVTSMVLQVHGVSAAPIGMAAVIDLSIPKPTNVCATTAPGTVRLTWDLVVDPQVVSFQIEYQRADIVGESWSVAGTSAQPSTSFSVAGLASANYRFRVASVNSAGSMSEWGSNCLIGWGDMTNSSVPAPTAIGALQQEVVKSVDLDGDTSCSVGIRGTVACWGRDDRVVSGAYGGGFFPVPVSRYDIDPMFPDALDVAVGTGHACIAVLTGGVRCWGNNSSGQLGNGSLAVSATSVPVLGPSDLTSSAVRSLSASGESTCAVSATGKLYCWGANSYGQLGLGTTTSYLTPMLVNGGSLAGKTIAAVSVGNTTCAIATDGSLSCWGYGYVGDGTTSRRLTPVLVAGGALSGQRVATVSATTWHTCATTELGALACWGSGYVGDGTSSERLTPVLVNGGSLAGTTVTQVSAGTTSCAVTSLGELSCWGTGADGQLGLGATTAAAWPTTVNSGALAGIRVSHVSTGANHTCANSASGIVACWGWNGYGEIGEGSTTWRFNTPQQTWQGAFAGREIASLSVGNAHACAVDTLGQLGCWGGNSKYELGSPVGGSAATTPASVAAGALVGQVVTQVSAGSGRTCATTESGFVVCWGGGAGYTPQAVTSGDLSGRRIVQVAVGESHVCALSDTGSVTCWGDNFHGQLGDPTGGGSPVSAMNGVLSTTTAVTLAAGLNHTCAVLADSTVACWGDDDYGQSGALANGDYYWTDQEVPTRISTRVFTASNAALQLGDGHSCAVAASPKTAYCWGRNDWGQIGDGVLPDSGSPRAVTLGFVAGRSVAAIAAGAKHSCAVLVSGEISCWGIGFGGQLATSTNVATNGFAGVPTRSQSQLQIDPTVFDGGGATSIGRWNGVARPTPIGPVVFDRPVRLVDTRAGTRGLFEDYGDISQKALAGDTFRFARPEIAGVPAGASLALTVTAVAPSASGGLKLYPCTSFSTTRPTTSFMTFIANQNRSNSGVLKSDSSGGLCIYSSATTHFVVDVTGWIPASTSYRPLGAAARLFDTRSGSRGSLEAGSDMTTPFAAGTVRRYVPGGVSGIPSSGVLALSINVTGLAPTSSGQLSVYPCSSTSSAVPKAIEMSFVAGVNVSTGGTVILDATGGICVRSSGSTHVAFDVAGWYPVGSTLRSWPQPSLPKRLVDTRVSLKGVLESTDISTALSANSVRRFVLGGVAGFAASRDLVGVLLTITALGPTASGLIKVWPCSSTSTPAPASSVMSFTAGTTVSNSALVGTSGADGGFCVVATANTNVTIDAVGWFVR